MREFVTVKTFAEKTHVSERSIWRGVRSGSIPSIRIGKSIRIPEDAVDAMYEQPAARNARPVISVIR